MDQVDEQASRERPMCRSRTSRALVQRRRWGAAAVAALLAIVIGVSSVSTFGALTGSNAVEAAIGKTGSFADLIRSRSPGARSGSELIITKHPAALARARAAAKRRVAPMFEQPKIAPVEVSSLLETPPVSPVAIDMELPTPVVELGVPTTQPGEIVLAGGGPGSPSVALPPATFPTTTPSELVPVPSAVPESSTWAAMLVGFGFVGWRLRLRTSIELAGTHA